MEMYLLLLFTIIFVVLGDTEQKWVLENKGIYESINDKFCLQNSPKQGRHCSTGWALAVTMALRHRYCLKYGWNYYWELSAQQVTACAKKDGCQGGTLEEALSYINRTGLSTGLCYPIRDVSNPRCEHYDTKCPSGDSIDFGKILGSSDYKRLKNDIEIEEELKHGGVPCCFNLYKDFIHFFQENPQGIYPPPTASEKEEGILCGMIVQSIKRTDEELNIERTAWIIQGSWGEDFADQGYFAIERNCKSRDLQLESNSYSVTPL